MLYIIQPSRHVAIQSPESVERQTFVIDLFEMSGICLYAVVLEKNKSKTYNNTRW